MEQAEKCYEGDKKIKKKLSQKRKGCDYASNMLDPKEDIFFIVMDVKNSQKDNKVLNIV